MEKFKVNDWVYVKITKYGEHLKEGDIFKIPDLNYNKSNNERFIYFEEGKSIATYRLRKCLPHEIPNNEPEIKIW